MELIARGDRYALEELYERYFELLFRFSLGFLKSTDRAEDAVQEVFIALIDASSTFDTSRRFRTWILSLMANRCKNMLRNEHNRNRLLDQYPRESTNQISSKIDLAILREEIRNHLTECSDKEQTLYHLRFEMEMGITEIAELMQIPEGSVKSGLFYLIKKLRKPLTKINHEFRK